VTLRTRCAVSSLLSCALSFFAFQAFADASAPVSSGADERLVAAEMEAARQPINVAQPNELVGKELPEWVDPITSSASRLASSCGLTLEARLTGDYWQNFLNLSVANDSDARVHLDLSNVMVRFGSGLTRRLKTPFNGPSAVPPHAWRHHTFAFPAKADFEHEDRLSVEVHVSLEHGQTCVAMVGLSHRPNAKVPERSYTSFSPREFALGVNVHFAATGDLKRIAANVNPGFDLTWALFLWPRHGIAFDVAFDHFGRKGLPAVAPDQAANPISGLFFGLGYNYRMPLKRRLWFEYDLSAGVYVLSAETPDNHDVVAKSTSFGFREKLKLNFLLLDRDDRMRVRLGPALIHSYIPTGDFGATSASGNLFGAALYLSGDY